MANKVKSGFIKKLLLVYLVLDLIWAFLIATFGATILNQIGVMGGAGEGAVALGTGLGWLIAFIIAFIQGAIFLTVITGFVFVIMIVIAALSGTGSGGTTRP